MLLGTRSRFLTRVWISTSSIGHPRLHQQVVDGLVQLVVRHAQTGGQRALRVQVHQQHPPAVLGQRGAQVDRRRGLADAALLVAHRDDLGRAVARSRLGVRDRPRRPAGQADLRMPLPGWSVMPGRGSW